MGRRGRPRHPDILTPREWEVLELLRQRLSNEQIAERLGIRLDGAKYHVSEILSKLGVATREEAASLALEERRRWWGSWSLWARIAGAGSVAAAIASIAAILLAIFSGKSEEVALQTSPTDSEFLLTGGHTIRFEDCGSDPDWVQPPLDQVARHPYLTGVPSQQIRDTYGSRFFTVGGGLSVNRGWMVSVGLEVLEDERLVTTTEGQPPLGPGCATFNDSDRFRLYLIDYTAQTVRQNGNEFVVQVTSTERGYSAITVFPDSGEYDPESGSAIYFIDTLTGSLLGCRGVLCSKPAAVRESSVCGVSLAPREKAGPLKMRFGSGTVCWTDVDNEASYRVEGTVHYVSGGCDGYNDAPSSGRYRSQ